MIDVEKIKAQSSLAKSLVERGFATDVEEACMMIENQGLVHSNERIPYTERQERELVSRGRMDFVDEVRTMQHKESVMREASGPNSVHNSRVAGDSSYIELSRKVEFMEKTINELKAFVSKYRESNDKNLKELDQSLNSLKNMRQSSSNGTSQMQSQPVVEQARRDEIPEAKPQTGRGDTLNPRDYAVEKIFNFSNGNK